MDKKTYIALLSAAGIIILGLILYISVRPDPIVVPADTAKVDTTSQMEIPVSDVTTTSKNETLQYKSLKISNPQPGATITSPLEVTGEAAGWYFEATFPIRLEDDKGNKIAESYVTAQGDWMTTGFVPFEGELKFTVPEGAKEGKLIFEKSNPSDLPQNADSIAIPVKFAE